MHNADVVAVAMHAVTASSVILLGLSMGLLQVGQDKDGPRLELSRGTGTALCPLHTM